MTAKRINSLLGETFILRHQVRKENVSPSHWGQRPSKSVTLSNAVRPGLNFKGILQ